MCSRGIALIILFLGVLMAPAAAGEAGLSIDGTLAASGPGEAMTVSVVLHGAHNGLAGYNISVGLQNQSVAEITRISSPDWASIHTNGTVPAPSTWASAVDLTKAVEPGTDALLLMNLTIRSLAKGATDLVVTPEMIDDDVGGRYVLGAVTGRLTVGQTVVTTVTTTGGISSSGSSGGSGGSDMSPAPPARTSVTDSPPTLSPTVRTETTAIPETDAVGQAEATGEVSSVQATTAHQSAGADQTLLLIGGLAIAGILTRIRGGR
jgi:hypothetical protein